MNGIIIQYTSNNRPNTRQNSLPKAREGKVSTVPFPASCGPIQARHQKYLSDRGFDPDFLEQEYDLRGTGPVGSYKFRVIAPIIFRRKIVSFQGRDISNLSPG